MSPKQLRTHLFFETSHSPSLVDLLGYEEAAKVIDFCFIANPYYPTPEMMQLLVERLPALIKSYPSSNPRQNAKRLAEVLHVNPEHLIVGNGATELIAAICEFLVDSLAVPVPTFSEYLDKIPRRSLALYELRRETDYQLDLGAYLQWLRREGIHSALVINPGNPTGQTIPLGAMRAFLQAASWLDVVLVDESFIDFAGEEIPSLLPYTERYSNLVIVRSMSKHCGVPGLRLGYCCTANRYFLNRLSRILPTWNINTLAEYFLSLLPPTDAEYHESRIRLIGDVRCLYRGLVEIGGFFAYPTGANFVLVRIDLPFSAKQLQLKLLIEDGLYVRDCTNKLGMDDRHIRIATQGLAKDARLLHALRRIAAAPDVIVNFWNSFSADRFEVGLNGEDAASPGADS